MRRLQLLLFLFAPAALLGQQSFSGFTPAHSAAQRELESLLLAHPDPDTARAMMHRLAAGAHVAGTPAQQATASYVLTAMGRWGLDTSRATFEVYLPFHDSTIVEVVGSSRTRLDLTEPPLREDPTTAGAQWPAFNGYSGAGDVTAPVVYVNYGLPTDYDQLAAMGVSVAGKVVIARYGRSFRGIKAREAEEHGAVGLILYSDPADDGFMIDEVYPAGPMRNPAGVQRGSLFNGEGDPSTPGRASLPGGARLPLEQMDVSRIPVVPIGYGNASRFLAAMGGSSVPAGWQGGLGYRYHLGDDALQARVAVWPETGDRALKTIVNTFGVLRGAVHPEQLVIVGAHRDAWGPGALDDVSGTISVLEAARAWAAAAAAGHRPDRTLVFATWDAEEWGLIGSTEWVEAHGDSLTTHAVAYINQDVVASGQAFSAGGTWSLQQLVRDVVARVPQPGDSGMVLDAWTRRTARGDRPGATLGDLGGGSDFVPFYNHLGVPSIEFGFGGRGGSYHSAYDTWTFAERFADPGYRSHVAAAQVVSLLMGRLANADVLPFEFGDLGGYLVDLVDRTRAEPGAEQITAALDDLASAAALFRDLGQRAALARNAGLAQGDMSAATAAHANQLLRGVERALLDPDGLPSRPFFRNLIFAADRDNGYANVQYPAIVEALRDGDPAGATRAAANLAARVRTAAGLLDQARATLAPPGR